MAWNSTPTVGVTAATLAEGAGGAALTSAPVTRAAAVRTVPAADRPDRSMSIADHQVDGAVDLLPLFHARPGGDDAFDAPVGHHPHDRGADEAAQGQADPEVPLRVDQERAEDAGD